MTAPEDTTNDNLDDGQIVDELPEDLNLDTFASDYTIPNNNRRKIPAAMYLVMALGTVAIVLARNGDSALVNNGLLIAAVGLGAFGIFGLVTGTTLKIDETDALHTASTQVGFEVGHASAQMVWRGWLSRPVWRVLMYSAENPPLKRGLVLVDGQSGEVIEWFAEANPEDWAVLR